MTWDFSSPSSIQKSYESGFVGAIADVDGFQRLAEESRRLFGAAPLAEIAGSGEGKLSIPYVSVLKHVKAYAGRQTQGDCVSWGTVGACLISAVGDFVARGESETLVLPFATEPIYGLRGHSGEGASCATLARAVCEGGKGGLLLRQPYPEIGEDFTTYQGQKGSNWGRNGTPEKICAEMRKHQVKQWHVVESLEEARDLLANHYGVNGCSGYSFSDKRDEWGQSPRTKTGWNHSMSWIAYDDRPLTHEKYGDSLVCIDQSWGNWNSGGWHADYGPTPEGAFWILGRHARGMISGGGVVAFGGVDGWKRRKHKWSF
jgi:hypothetical protein